MIIGKTTLDRTVRLTDLDRRIGGDLLRLRYSDPSTVGSGVHNDMAISPTMYTHSRLDSRVLHLALTKDTIHWVRGGNSILRHILLCGEA